MNFLLGKIVSYSLPVVHWKKTNTWIVCGERAINQRANKSTSTEYLLNNYEAYVKKSVNHPRLILKIELLLKNHKHIQNENQQYQ